MSEQPGSSSGLRAVLDRINARWPNMAGFARDIVGRGRGRKITIEERRQRAHAATANRERRQFEQREKQPLPARTEARQNALDVLAHVRCDLRLSCADAEQASQRHFGRWVRQLTDNEIHELCAQLEREAKR